MKYTFVRINLFTIFVGHTVQLSGAAKQNFWWFLDLSAYSGRTGVTKQNKSFMKGLNEEDKAPRVKYYH